MDRIRVLVADDHAVMRAGLRMLLDAQLDMAVVAEAGNGRDAVAQVKASRPDVVLLDLSMPGLGGIAAVELLRKEAPQAQVLILTMHEDPEYLRQALEAGASGYLVKSAADTELLAAIRAIRRGEKYVYSSLTGALLDMALEKRQKQVEQRGVADLSKREIEVLRLLALGHTNKQIADRLFLSVKTIETYRARIIEKLQLPTRAELVEYAIKHGLLSADE
jgi:two-component system response regulator NreC